MKMFSGSRPSPAMVVAVFALVFAMVGSAVAGTDGLSEKITKSKVKKISKKQANKVLDGREANLNVNSARTADKRDQRAERRDSTRRSATSARLDESRDEHVIARDLPGGRYLLRPGEISSTTATSLAQAARIRARSGGSSTHIVDGQGLSGRRRFRRS